MRLETDPKRVAELAGEREDENWRFRSFLRGLDITIEELDALVHDHYAVVSSRIDCCACGNCCRKADPLLLQADIQRLASGLNLCEADVIEQYLQPGDEEDSFEFKASPCPLLSGNMCTVYDSRPEDCRSYPHLHSTEFVLRLIQAVVNCSICPIVFNVFERLKDDLWPERDAERDMGWDALEE